MSDIKIIASYCEENLNLDDLELSEGYYYQSLPLCVIDAVFSIGVKYESTRNTVIKYCDYFNLKRIRDTKESFPKKEEQESISDFINKLIYLGTKVFSEEVFKNKQRTSATNGILKAEAVLHFANLLKDFELEYLQDVHKIMYNDEFENKIKLIPGQKSGISLNYFFMLCGSNEFIKPDRMVLRFLEGILKRKVGIEEAQIILKSVSENLKEKYSDITPRKLDHTIWKSLH